MFYGGKRKNTWFSCKSQILFVYLQLFTVYWRWNPMRWVESWGWTLHEGKASHDALSIGWWNLGNFILQVKDTAEFDVTGMLKMYPVVCLRAYAFTAHLRVYQHTLRGYHSVRQLARSPRTASADGQKVDTHVFRCVVKWNGIKRSELGCHRHNIV